MSNTLLEMFVLSKPYFDRHGLIVAEADGVIVGFIHVGFGPDETHRDLSTDEGLVCVLIVGAHPQRHEILNGLLEQGEAYLRQRGASRFHVGAVFPQSPFYMGVYGGSDLPAVSVHDTELQQLYEQHGYAPADKCYVYERVLHRYRPPVDRRLVQHRRSYRLIPQVNPQPPSWWNACVFGPSERIRFALDPKVGVGPHGEVTFWDMGPLSTRMQAGGMGMIDLQIKEEMQHQGLGTFLVSESLKHLENSGIHRIETQVTAHNTAAIKLLEKVKFDRIREGHVYIKTE